MCICGVQCEYSDMSPCTSTCTSRDEWKLLLPFCTTLPHALKTRSLNRKLTLLTRLAGQLTPGIHLGLQAWTVFYVVLGSKLREVLILVQQVLSLTEPSPQPPITSIEGPNTENVLIHSPCLPTFFCLM